MSTDVMSDHTGRRHASRGGGCSKTSAHTGRSGGGGGMLVQTVLVPCATCRQTHRSANIASRRTPSTTTYARRQSKANSHGLVSVCPSVRPSHNVSVATTGALTRPAYVPALPTTDNKYLSSYSLPHSQSIPPLPVDRGRHFRAVDFDSAPLPAVRWWWWWWWVTRGD